MKKAILHIGMHKTGSTAIQSAYKTYNDGKVSYANLGFENHSIPLYTIFSGQEHAYHIWKMAQLTAAEIDARKSQFITTLQGVLAAPPTETLLFSGEDLSDLPSSGVKDLAALLDEFGYAVKVIAYVRSPLSFIVSYYQEFIKSGRNLVVPNAPNFQARIENYITAFGRENVEIREFSKAKLLGGDILEDFAAATQTHAPQKGENSNESLSLEALRVVYTLNTFVDSVRDTKALCRAKQACLCDLRRLFPGKAEIPDALISPRVNADDVRWLDRVSGIDFTKDIATTTAPFQPDHLAAYIGTPSIETISTLYATLRARGAIPDLPLVPHLIIARYFMSFLEHQTAHHDRKFDPESYLTLNPDVRNAGVDPYRHYVEYGMREGREF